MKLKRLEEWLDHKNRDGSPNVVVLHATAGASAKSSIEHLDREGLSYHYVISRDSKDSDWTKDADGSESIIFQCVPNEGHAFHSSTKVPVPEIGGRVNAWSIGISLANIQNGMEPYTPQQFTALEELLRSLKKEVPSLKYLTTHAVIQPWNRSDPLGVKAKDLADKCGYTWWQPTEDVIKKYRPK